MAQKIITLWVAFWVLFSFVSLLAVIVFDAWAIYTQQPSVTDQVRALAKANPILVAVSMFTIGVLVGHLLWAD